MDLFPWLLFLHVFGAIIAFGPTYSLPILGRMGGMERQHGNFATRVALAISKQRILPLAILQGITGVGLILTGPEGLLDERWLQAGIVLYLVALGYAYFVQTPTVQAIINLTSNLAPAAPGGPPVEPPVALFGLVRRAQLGGMFLAILVATIVFLMVVKPF